MYFKVKLLQSALFTIMLRNSQECVLSLSTLQFNFISLIFYYLQVQFFKNLLFLYLKYTTSVHSIQLSTLFHRGTSMENSVMWNMKCKYKINIFVFVFNIFIYKAHFNTTEVAQSAVHQKKRNNAIMYMYNDV